MATGNSNTLFDQNAVKEGRSHTPDWLARKLLVYQSFSPSGRIGVALWRGKRTGENSSSNNSPSKKSPCAEGNMLLAFLKGKSLFETIWWNLIPLDTLPLQMGKPVWEYDLDTVNDEDIDILCHSWLGRLVPFSRTIKLFENCTDMILANGPAYPKLPDVREPMASVYNSGKKKSKWTYLPTNTAQHPWRNLHAILAQKNQDETGRAKGAYTLKNIHNIKKSNANEVYELWISGIERSKTKNAKVIDSVFWSVQISADLVGSFSHVNYENGVKRARSSEIRLVSAIKMYCDHFKLEAEKKEKEQLQSVSSMVVRAKSLFWSAMDRLYPILIQEAQVANGTLSEWNKILNKEMIDAYEKVCPHRTSRQIQAFALGKRQLFLNGTTKDIKTGSAEKQEETGITDTKKKTTNKRNL